MNLELIISVFIVLCTIAGGVVAFVIEESLLTGAILGGMIGFSPLLILGAIYLFLQIWSPDRPNCMCGRCKSDDYDFIDFKSNFEEHIYFYKCPHCGREYRVHGNRFALNTPEGTKPYMKTSRWGRWVKDNTK